MNNGTGSVIELQFALRVRRHEALHVFLRLLEGLRLVDQTFADIIGEIIAQAACDRIAFLKNQKRRGPAIIGRDDGVPRGFEIVQIPLQFLGGAANPGGAHDGAHAVGNDQAVHGVAHLLAILALDAARHAAGARIVRHQHQEAAGETDESGERGAFVAAFLFFNLDDQFLAFLQKVLDVEPAAVRRLRSEVFLGDFLQRQEAMALRAIFDERRFEAGLYAGDSAFIDVGFFLFPGRDLNR